VPLDIGVLVDVFFATLAIAEEAEKALASGLSLQQPGGAFSRGRTYCPAAAWQLPASAWAFRRRTWRVRLRATARSGNRNGKTSAGLPDSDDSSAPCKGRWPGKETSERTLIRAPGLRFIVATEGTVSGRCDHCVRWLCPADVYASSRGSCPCWWGVFPRRAVTKGGDFGPGGKRQAGLPGGLDSLMEWRSCLSSVVTGKQPMCRGRLRASNGCLLEALFKHERIK